MGVLNLFLQEGRIYCRKCLCQIPATFLVCPVCAGLVQEPSEGVTPPLAKPPQPYAEQHAEAEYPA